VATFAIGDIQGCGRTLERLLQRIGFDPAADRILQVGDLVNRGPRSLQVLRWARSLGDRLAVVLGNHELHLLARAAGVRKAKPRDTLDAVFAAADREELVEWLRHRPLLHREGRHLLVHAGLLPAWSTAEAERRAREAETVLRSARWPRLLEALWSADPTGGEDDLSESRLATNVFTRLRTCTSEGVPCIDFDGRPEDAPPGCVPWFDLPGPASRGVVVFGHWAALGLRIERDYLALDSGCVWGNALTAVRLEDRAVFQEPFADG
jgi:bis(5'-nucleosyl)-tetraphosphatase (symmetrical)